MTSALQHLIGTAADRPLTRAEAELAFEALFNGEATPSQIGGFLMALRTRGETVDEYAAAAAVMRAKCNAVRAPMGAMDIVGTGGDHAISFGYGQMLCRSFQSSVVYFLSLISTDMIFNSSMNNQIGISTNGRSEMKVIIFRQSIMSIGGTLITSLL